MKKGDVLKARPSQITNGPGDIPNMLKPQIVSDIDPPALPMARKSGLPILPLPGYSHVNMRACVAGLEVNHYTSWASRHIGEQYAAMQSIWKLQQ